MEVEDDFSSSAGASSAFTCNVVKFVMFSSSATASSSTRPNQVYERLSDTAYASSRFTAQTVVGELANGRYRR